MNILLVEDEERIAAFIAKGLSAEGHHVERANTAAEGTAMALAYDFDVVLLDLMLPDGQGHDVLKRIRVTKPDVPVIVVSALGEVEERVELLDLGANDYLVKPFAFAELAARIRAVTRQGQASGRVLETSRISLDTKTRTARTAEGRTVDLPSREFALLEYLMRHVGQVLTRQQVLDAVWGIGFDTDSNIVDVYVGYLRRKLDGDGESMIETVRGAGYRVRE